MIRSGKRMRALLFGAICLSVLPSFDSGHSQGAAVPAMTVSQFMAAPAALLSRSKNLASDVALLLGADHGTLSAIIGLLPTATLAQQRAIIAGLGQVVIGLARTDPDFAQAIQQAVARTGNPTWIAALSTEIGEIAIGTASGAGGGGTGGGGPTGNGIPIGGPNVGTAIAGNTGTVSLGTNLFTGGTVPVTTGGTTGTTSGLSKSVSPF
jgi:hypothetical protein